MKDDKMTVAYCGTRGSFAEIAANKLYPNGVLFACATFQEAYDLADKGKTDVALLPLENSYAGEVAATVDLTYRGDLFITDVYQMRVEQNLIGVKGARLSDVKTVLSHPQALAQCAEYISEKGFLQQIAENTAFAAKTVAERGDKSLAAIASRTSAELYGLDVIAENVAESKDNTTRFAVFGKTPPEKRAGEHLILLFAVRDRSGALAEALTIIARYGYNMKSLHSRPLKDKPWQYYFYVEAEGSGDENALLNALKICCADQKIAGRLLPGSEIL